MGTQRKPTKEGTIQQKVGGSNPSGRAQVRALFRTAPGVFAGRLTSTRPSAAAANCGTGAGGCSASAPPSRSSVTALAPRRE